MKFRFLLFLLLTAWACAQPGVQIFDMRGDEGVLEDFGPRGAVFTPQGQILVCDRRYPVFHLFDLQGRRFRLLNHPQSVPEVNYNGLCSLKENQFLAMGSHWHEKNNTRYVSDRSWLHLMELSGEQFTPESGKVNLTPDRALRATGYFGESVKQPMEMTGIAADPKHNRIFICGSRNLSPQGDVLVFEGKLDLFLAQSKEFKLDLMKTSLKPEVEPSLGVPFFVSDMQYVPDKGLVLLLTSGTNDNRQFGSSQLWYMRGGFGPAKLLKKELAPGNRATGLAIRPINDKGDYQVVLVCDNNMEDSRIPSRMVVLPSIRFPVK